MVQPEKLYHIFNRGNNRDGIFYERRNYYFFLKKIEIHFLPHLDILAYCLMKNHFHFLVSAKQDVVPIEFSNDLRIMLRSYTRAINKQEGRTGSLFQQHTKVKALEDYRDHNYPLTCFHYIHQNPLKARLVDRLEDYEMSSFKDYLLPDKESLCNRNLARELLDLPYSDDEFKDESYKMIDFEGAK